ncbi:hypothetical protein N8I77_003781 [Diaporthe amygdali]|uniref:Uncharacterized protein n=1 Tax=Phomopsis amygdali TaxID=1214568 RepID=A0AAD9SK04_PHOAM|nr:hypothetical protein N8I77_003781 [Diaporthe amygdali]
MPRLQFCVISLSCSERDARLDSGQSVELAKSASGHIRSRATAARLDPSRAALNKSGTMAMISAAMSSLFLRPMFRIAMASLMSSGSSASKVWDWSLWLRKKRMMRIVSHDPAARVYSGPGSGRGRGQADLEAMSTSSSLVRRATFKTALTSSEDCVSNLSLMMWSNSLFTLASAAVSPCSV